MRMSSSAIAVVSMTALIAGCAQMDAERAFQQASNTTPTSDPFNQALYEQCLQFADFEFNRMQDWQSTQFHARAAIQGATQGVVEPEPINTPDLQPRNLPQDSVAELTEARQRYLAAFEEGKQNDDPENMAAAVCAYNCWIEQQAENRQPDDIEVCKASFERAMDEVENVQVAAFGETIVLSADVLFDFDKSNIKPEFDAELDTVANILVDNSNELLLVWGFTDSIGTEQYNLGLSERRSNSVASYLEAQGVTADRMVVQGIGEEKPVASNETEEGRALNRRVEIRKR